MDEIMQNTSVEEEVVSQDVQLTEGQKTFQNAVEAQLQKIRNQSMLIGFQTALGVVLEKILAVKGKPGKTTLRDYERLMKDIEQFCLTGLERKVDEDDDESNTTKPETVQN